MSSYASDNLRVLQRELKTVLQKDHGGEDRFGTLLSYIGPVDSAGMEGLLALAEKSAAASGGARQPARRVHQLSGRGKIKRRVHKFFARFEHSDSRDCGLLECLPPRPPILP